MAAKIDFKKEYKNYYTASKNPEVIELKEFQYLMIDGMGSPGEAKEYSFYFFLAIS